MEVGPERTVYREATGRLEEQARRPGTRSAVDSGVGNPEENE